MTVYAELVLLENWMVDYMLLLLSGRVTRIKPTHPLLSALGGGLYACLAPLWPPLTAWYTKAAVLVGMILAAFGHKNARGLFLTAAAFAGAASLLAGLMTLTAPVLFYSSEPTVLLALSCAFASVLLYRLSLPFLRLTRVRGGTVEMTVEGQTVTAYLDTGNTLSYKGSPVVLLSDAVLPLPEKPLIIPYRALGRDGALLGFRPARVTIGSEAREVACVIALCHRTFPGGAQALLPPEMLGKEGK